MVGIDLGYSSDSDFDAESNIKIVKDDIYPFDPVKEQLRKRPPMEDFKATKAKKRARKEFLKTKKRAAPEVDNGTIHNIEESEILTSVDVTDDIDKAQTENEQDIPSNKAKSHVPPSQLTLSNPPDSYQTKFPTLIPGFKDYFTPKKLIGTHKLNSPLTSLKFHPFGHVYLTSTTSSDIQLWDTYKIGRLLRTFSGHKGTVLSVEWVSNTQFISVGKDGWVKVWNAEPAKDVAVWQHKFNAPATPTVAIGVPEKPELLVGLESGTIEHFDYSKQNKAAASNSDSDLETLDDGHIQSYTHHQRSITSIIATNIRIISTSLDKTINVWPMRINMPYKHIVLQKSIHRLAFHPSRDWFVAEESGGGILAYTTGFHKTANEDGKKIHSINKTFTIHDGSIPLGTALSQGPTFMPDGKTMILGSEKGIVYFWNWSGKLIRGINVFKELNGVSSVNVHPYESSMVLIGGENGVVGILN